MLWGGLVALSALLATTGVAITAAVTRTPERHVEAYLRALAADDAVSLRLLAGLPATAPMPLGDAGTPTTLAARATEPRAGGRVAVIAVYGERGIDMATTVFVVEPAGFTTPTGWRFVEPPIATVSIAGPVGIAARVNDKLLAAPASDGSAPRIISAFVPARVAARLESPWLTSATETVRAGNGPSAVDLDGEPNRRLERAVRQQLTGFLEECATQRVLFPRGCPFGYSVADRVLGEPQWRLQSEPTVSFSPAPAGGGYRVEGSATMGIRAEVQRLRDGVIEQLDTTAPAGVVGRLTLTGTTPELVIEAPAP